MALTKIPRGLLDTGIADSSDATAITIDSSENVAIASGALAVGQSTFSGGNVLADFHGSGNAVGASLAFANDHNTDKFYVGLEGNTTGDGFLYQEKDADINFYTNDTFRVKIDNSGKVGIGETSPANPLSISYATHGLYSQHRPSHSVGAGQEMYYKFNTANSTPEIFGSIYTEIEDNTNGAESGKIALRAAKAGTLTTGLMLVGSTGNVGIGDTSPFAKLHVEDTSWSSGSPYGAVAYIQGGAVNDLNWGHLLVSQSGTTTDTGGRISLGANGENPIAGIRAKYKGATYGDLAFLTRPSGGTNIERMVIKSTGLTQFFTGDGTSNIAEFHTNASSGSVSGYISFAPQGTHRAYIGTGSSLLSGAAVSDFIIRSEGDLVFNSNGNNERMRISSAGTATFQHPVVVQSGATQGYYIENNAGNAVTPRITNDANDWTIIRPGVSGGDVAINNYANTANRVIFTDEGKVGIGRAPDVTLEVDGPLKITNNTAGGISQTHTNMTAANSGKLLINFGSIGTMTTGDTIVFSYAATSWKSWFFKIRWSSTGGYMGELWAGGYNNNSDGYQILNPRYYAAASGDGANQGTVEGATLTVTRSGQGNTMTLTLNNSHVHPLFEIEYACGGGEGYPNASKATITVNS